MGYYGSTLKETRTSTPISCHDDHDDIAPLNQMKEMTDDKNKEMAKLQLKRKITAMKKVDKL